MYHLDITWVPLRHCRWDNLGTRQYNLGSTWIPLGYHLGTEKRADTTDTPVLFFHIAVIIFGTTQIPLGYGKDTTLILHRSYWVALE